MKAPKKIYFSQTEDGRQYFTPAIPFKREFVEYVCKDAFIEKAVKFINKTNLYLYHCISEECDYVDTDKFTENFRNYMKGE